MRPMSFLNREKAQAERESRTSASKKSKQKNQRPKDARQYGDMEGVGKRNEGYVKVDMRH